MTTDPGSVPRCAIPLASDTEEFDYEAQDRYYSFLLTLSLLLFSPSVSLHPSSYRVNGNKFKKFCKRCNAFKPRRAHHCSVCKRCIIKMDHHCPWLNNCVGIGNHKLFLQFLFWVNLMSCYSLVLNIARYVNCVNVGLTCGTVLDHTLSLLVLLESILFALFTVCMMCDQWSVVTTNQTQIDRLKQAKSESKNAIFNEVFGSDHSVLFRLHFLYPIPVYFPPSIKDEILGYSVPPENIHNSKSTVNRYEARDEYDGSHEMTPLTSAEDAEDSDVLTLKRLRGGADMSHIFNSPGGHGASSSASNQGIPRSFDTGPDRSLPRPLTVSHPSDLTGTGSGSSGFYESKEEEELLAEIDRRTHIQPGGVSNGNGDMTVSTTKSSSSVFPSLFPSFSSLSTGSLLAPPPRPDPPSSPSKESPHRGPKSEAGSVGSSNTIDTPSSGTSSNQESLLESKNIFMRKRPSAPSTLV